MGQLVPCARGHIRGRAQNRCLAKKLVATHREIQLNTKLFEWVSRVVGGLMKTPFYLIDIGVSRTDS